MSEETSKENIIKRLTLVLFFGVIVLAFTVGILWQKVSSLEKNGGTEKAQVDTGAVEGALPENGKLSGDQAEKIEKITDSDHVKGSKDAEIIIFEYSDMECPFCASFHSTAKQATDEYGDKVAWVYRHYPLDAIHSRARPAANASECVADIAGNDAFWSFIDNIFEDQETNLTDSSLKTNAENLGVDPGEFDNCFSENKFNDKVDNQYQSGVDAGVTGTPGSFVMNKNGDVWVLPGAVPFENLKSVIDEALNSS